MKLWWNLLTKWNYLSEDVVFDSYLWKSFLCCGLIHFSDTWIAACDNLDYSHSRTLPIWYPIPFKTSQPTPLVDFSSSIANSIKLPLHWACPVGVLSHNQSQLPDCHHADEIWRCVMHSQSPLANSSLYNPHAYSRVNSISCLFIHLSCLFTTGVWLITTFPRIQCKSKGQFISLELYYHKFIMLTAGCTAPASCKQKKGTRMVDGWVIARYCQHGTYCITPCILLYSLVTCIYRLFNLFWRTHMFHTIESWSIHWCL